MNCRYARASLTVSPLMASVTRRILRGGIPMSLAIARTCIFLSFQPLANRSGPLTFSAGMATKVACRGELTEFVPHHVLGDINGHMGLAVMHADRHSHHLGEDRRGARPGLDYTPVAAAHNRQDLLSERLMNVWPFFP